MRAEAAALSRRLGIALVLGLLCVALQNLRISYLPATAENVSAQALPSLVHLQWGLVLAIALLSRDRLYLITAFAAIFAGWLLRYQRAPDFAWAATLPFLAGHVAMYFATLGCARLLGWPRTGTRQRLRVRDLLPYILVALLLYPALHAVAFWLTQTLAGHAGNAAIGRVMGNVVLARHFGVLVITLPVLMLWTGYRQQAPIPGRIPWWEWLLPSLLVTLMGAFVASRPDLLRIGLAAVVDLRFAIAALLAWAISRLPWRYSAPLLATSSLLLVGAIAASGRLSSGASFQQLAHAAIEVSSLQMMLVYMMLMARDNRDALLRMVEDSRTDGFSGVPNVNALRHDLGRRAACPRDIGFLAIDRVEDMTAALGLPAQEALTATLHAYLSPHVAAYTLGIGRFALLPHADECDWPALLRRLDGFAFEYRQTTLHVEPFLGIAPLELPAGLDAALHAAYKAAQAARRHGELVPVRIAAVDGHDEDRRTLRTHSLALALLRRRRIVLHVQTLRRIDGHAGIDMGEVLCRLRDEDGRLLPPAEFMPELEASRGIVELDRAVIELLFDWMVRHPSNAGYARLSVNLTGRSLSSGDFRRWLLQRIDQHPELAARLCFELTENAVGSDFDQARPLFEELGRRGCWIALDDFGTGMQSFERLQRLHIDLLKIDGTFVRNLPDNRRDHDFVQAMVAIARACGAETVAEFVETPAHLERLRAMGVHWGQGYLFDRPLPLPD